MRAEHKKTSGKYNGLSRKQMTSKKGSAKLPSKVWAEQALPGRGTTGWGFYQLQAPQKGEHPVT